MKRKEWLLILALVFTGALSKAETANRFLQQGMNAIEENQLPQAVESFQQALALAQEREDLDPAQAHLALGTALAQAGSYEEAKAQLSEAIKTPNRDIQKRAQYNLGKIDYELALAAELQKDLQTANQNIQSSVNRFKDSIQLDPKDLQSKKNFELAAEKKIQIEEMLEQQEQEQEQNQDENQDSDEEQENDQEQDSDQENQDQQNQDSQDQENQDPSGDQNQEDSQDQQEQNSDQGENEEEQEQNAPEQGDEEEESQQEQQPAPENPEQMTEEEARNLLEAMKDKEEQQRGQYRIRLGRPVPVDKDW